MYLNVFGCNVVVHPREKNLYGEFLILPARWNWDDVQKGPFGKIWWLICDRFFWMLWTFKCANSYFRMWFTHSYVNFYAMLLFDEVDVSFWCDIAASLCESLLLEATINSPSLMETFLGWCYAYLGLLMWVGWGVLHAPWLMHSSRPQELRGLTRPGATRPALKCSRSTEIYGGPIALQVKTARSRSFSCVLPKFSQNLGRDASGHGSGHRSYAPTFPRGHRHLARQDQARRVLDAKRRMEALEVTAGDQDSYQPSVVW